MARNKKFRLNVLSIKKVINDDEDDTTYTAHYNMLVCMITSPLLFLGAIASFVLRYFVMRSDPVPVIADSLVLLLLGVFFEVFRRSRLKTLPNAIHIISPVYMLTFVFVFVRFYDIIGPSIWVIALIQVLFSMAQVSKTMLSYVLCAMFMCGMYITFFRFSRNYEAFYNILLLSLFTVCTVVAVIVHTIISLRHRKIRTQFREIKTQIAERGKIEEENLRLSYYDQLTDLPNRALFNERLSQSIVFAKRNDYRLYVLFLDVDMFKMVNDTLGHNMGDRLLVQVGARLSAALRKTDVVSRTGGDEFLILIQDMFGDMNIMDVVNRMLHKLRDPFYIDQHTFNITCSIGISTFPTDGGDAETLIKCADLSMYKAKEEGKNCFAFYSEDLKHIVQTEMDTIKDMQSALLRNEFVLHYQPQINGITGEIIGFEALIRWRHPARGMLLPGKFIHIAEKSGLIVPIGDWVLKTACIQNRIWQQHGLIRAPMAVNVSSSQIFSNSFYDRLSAILEETGLDPSLLELEITEQTLLKELDSVKQVLNRIKQLGVKIAIDDFGTGYSSIYYLKKLPIDRIKIPMEFVQGINNNIKDESIITVILALADNLNLEVIAEGVETQQQLEFLISSMCSNIQGFYFCRPLEPVGIENYCKENPSSSRAICATEA